MTHPFMLKTGSYLLLLKLQKPALIPIGKLGNIFFKQGWYVYVGSAFSGLTQRINRHLRREKKIHWHIDYFTQDASIEKVFIKESKKKEECTDSHIFSKSFSEIKNFGCSDCSCSSHLFFGKKENFITCISELNYSEFTQNT